MRINNAFIEEASCFSNSAGWILISYSVPGRNQSVSIRTIRLILSGSTRITGAAGQNTCICCLRPGMWVNVVFSSFMTQSIPPQAAALSVAVQRSPQPASSVTTGRIIMIDFDRNILYTENPFNRNLQTRFIITSTTRITNRFGAPIRLSALRPGQLVRITHANFQTASIPPQTTAFLIRQL